jgi:hypothetical protein
MAVRATSEWRFATANPWVTQVFVLTPPLAVGRVWSVDPLVRIFAFYHFPTLSHQQITGFLT